MSTIAIFQPETIVCHCGTTPPSDWNTYLQQHGYDGFHLRTEWGTIFRDALRHQPYYLWATSEDRLIGVMPLMFVSGPMFGRFLASQPYLNTGGVLADTDEAARRLISEATRLADHLRVKHLELRHETHVEHPRLNATATEKVHMRLTLPSSEQKLWDSLKSKVRSQVRKPRNNADLTCEFGHLDHLDMFYSIFCRNMRDLGTPPFPRSLFGRMLEEFGIDAEVCTVRFRGTPVASGFLLHGPGTTMIPSASSLREYNHTSCNMLMYWHSLVRAVERGQQQFDFGRSSVDAGTYRFKKQWGADEYPAVWQYYSRFGDVTDARPDSGKYDAVIAAWKRLPVWLTRLVGPSIVRGIP